jgi:Fic family protein
MKIENLTSKKDRLDQARTEGSGLPPALVANLDDWFKVELTYTSNALEGNTLTRQETALVVEKGLTVGGKSLQEHLEATNHAAALDWVREWVGSRRKIVSERDILEIHQLILKGIDDANAGSYRTVAVRISGSNVILPNPVKVPDLMEDFCRWLKRPDSPHPVILAAEAHYRLVSIHPFTDGNGRTARLLMNLILLLHGYPPAFIRKRERLAYLNSLAKAQLGGPKDDYLKLIAKAVDRSLDIYLKAIQNESTAEPSDDDLLKIGQLAEAAGETVRAIRFWTDEGLLVIADKTSSNYALYDPGCLERIRQIQDLKKQRFTLREIRDLLP